MSSESEEIPVEGLPIPNFEPTPVISLCEKCLTEHLPEQAHHPLFDKYLRALAENENFQRRARQDLQRARDDATRQLFSDLTTFIDNMFVILSNSADPQEGLKLVSTQVSLLLEKCNITPIFQGSEELQPFDPDKHQVVIMEENSESESDHVRMLVQGYLLRDKVLRVAQVKFIKGTKICS